MTRAGEKHSCSRSRSRSRSRSPNRGSGLSDNRNRGRSRSPTGRSFHESMMQHVGSSPPSLSQNASTLNGSWSSRSPEQGGQKERAAGSLDDVGVKSKSQFGEEEEGMIQAEEGINTTSG